MRIRTAFVSNSSSSSYVCEVCSQAAVVYDGESLENQGMAECGFGHIMCAGHLPDSYETYNDHGNDDLYGKVKKEFCPVCTMKTLRDDDVYNYIIKVLGIKEDEVRKEIHSKFKSHDKLIEFLRK
jgi:hypothetical protein